MTSSIRTNRYCFERCTQDEALAESIGGLKRYWVRSPLGSIDMYFERDHWPENVEFVRPVQDSDTVRLDWLDQNPVMAYRDLDYETGEVNNHHVVVDERRQPRTGIVKPSIREAIDTAMQTEVSK